MKKRTPPEIKVPGKFDPQIRLLINYFVTTLVVLCRQSRARARRMVEALRVQGRAEEMSP